MADQIFVTDCLPSDSVKSEAGFSIRATSTQDPDLLKFALDYPAYELPLDMWSSDPSPVQSPRRLAFVPAPRNTRALVHSTYVGEDTGGRKGNFFTHVIFYPKLTATQALESWGAAGWKTSYASGEPKLLPKLDDRPFKGKISEDYLSDFLSGKGANGDEDLATVICPSRLQKNPRCLQELLARTLDGYLFVSNDGPASGRDRLYLIGEPGLIALLLYGVVRMLPSQANEKVMFSTFENMHRSLRQFKLGLVCGTYTSDTKQSLDADFFKSRGYGLDTFPPNRASAELTREIPPVIQDFVSLASQRKWQEIDEHRLCHGPGKITEESLQRAQKLYRIDVRRKAGKTTADDLLELSSSSQGRELLEREHQGYWTFICDASLSSEQVREAFHGMLKARVSDLTARAADLLSKLDDKWRSHWDLEKAIEKSRERLTTLYVNLLQQAGKKAPSKPFLATFRVPLLREWQQLSPDPAVLPAPIQDLLFLTSARDFERLQNAALPDGWLAFSLGVALENSGADSWAADAIKSIPDRILQRFVANKLNGEKPSQEVLNTLHVLIPDPQSFRFFFRLVNNGLVLPPESAYQFLDDLGQTKHLSGGWLQEHNLQTFLERVGRYQERTAPLWQLFCRFLSKDVILHDELQRRLFDNLSGARERLKGSVPAEASEFLDDWLFLVQLFSEPKRLTSTKDVEATCQKRHLKILDLLKEYFAKVVQAHDAEHPTAVMFCETFEKCFPGAEFYQNQVGRFDNWLRVVKHCRDPQRQAGFQVLFLERCVSAEFRLQVAGERRSVLGESVVELVRNGLAQSQGTRASGSFASLKELLKKLTLRNIIVIFLFLFSTHLLFGFVGCWFGGRHAASNAAPDVAGSGKDILVPVDQLGALGTAFDELKDGLVDHIAKLAAKDQGKTGASGRPRSYGQPDEHTVRAIRDELKSLSDKVTKATAGGNIRRVQMEKEMRVKFLKVLRERKCLAISTTTAGIGCSPWQTQLILAGSLEEFLERHTRLQVLFDSMSKEIKR